MPYYRRRRRFRRRRRVYRRRFARRYRRKVYRRRNRKLGYTIRKMPAQLPDAVWINFKTVDLWTPQTALSRFDGRISFNALGAGILDWNPLASPAFYNGWINFYQRYFIDRATVIIKPIGASNTPVRMNVYATHVSSPIADMDDAAEQRYTKSITMSGTDYKNYGIRYTGSMKKILGRPLSGRGGFDANYLNNPAVLGYIYISGEVLSGTLDTEYLVTVIQHTRLYKDVDQAS